MEEPTEQSVEQTRFKSHLKGILGKQGFYEVDLSDIPKDMMESTEKQTLSDLGMSEIPGSESD